MPSGLDPGPKRAMQVWPFPSPAACAAPARPHEPLHKNAVYVFGQSAQAAGGDDDPRSEFYSKKRGKKEIDDGSSNPKGRQTTHIVRLRFEQEGSRTGKM